MRSEEPIDFQALFTATPVPRLFSIQKQNQLITACEQGEEETVMVLLKQGASPDLPDAKGKQPLGAVVWGMCPGVVKALLAQESEVAPMTWEKSRLNKR
jgi:hypothetical protein